MQSVLYYNRQGDRDVGRPSYGLSAVCAKATKKNKKIIENPLTNQKVYVIIKTQKKKGNKKMQKFDFYVSYLEVSKTTFKITNGGLIPFSAVADTFEEGRTKALEFAQSLARCYNDNEESTLFFRITV